MPQQPLPSVIGATERALGALLTATLSTSLIDGPDEWVYLNTLRGSETTRRALSERGLLDADGGVTERGARELARGRELVAAGTARLTADLSDEDVRVTITTLGTVRERAERLLATPPS